MLKRIKNWMIKKLGGFTQEEYDSRPPVKHIYVPPINSEQVKVVKASAEVTLPIEINRDDPFFVGRIYGMVMRELRPQLAPFLQLEYHDRWRKEQQVVRGTIWVTTRGERQNDQL